MKVLNWKMVLNLEAVYQKIKFTPFYFQPPFWWSREISSQFTLTYNILSSEVTATPSTPWRCASRARTRIDVNIQTLRTWSFKNKCYRYKFLLFLPPSSIFAFVSVAADVSIELLLRNGESKGATVYKAHLCMILCMDIFAYVCEFLINYIFNDWFLFT